MTNYINTEILCEAYSKLDIDIFHDKKKLKALEQQLVSFFEERAKFSFGEDVRIEVEFEEGSLITKLKVIGGAVIALTTAVSSYGSFREGVTQIASDATMLAHSANYEVIFRTKTAYCDRIDAERRKGIFGRVQELLDTLDSVHQGLAANDIPKNSAALLTFEKSVDALLAWEHRSDKFFGKISDKPTIGCIAAGLLEELEKLPEEPVWKSEIENGTFRAAVATNTSSKAGEVAAAAARMSEVVKSVKKAMRNRLDLVAPQKV
jgi:hypothetical protein